MSIATSQSDVERSTEPVSSLAIRTVKLTKKYGTTEAVRGIDLSVDRSEIFGLIGPDGAGKTTTFQILAGVMEASSGVAEVFGRPAREMRSETGYLTHSFSLYPDLTVMENIRYIGDLRRVPPEEIQSRSDRYLKMFDMHRFQDRLAGLLSGGMKQKLALMCALVPQPRVLLLDEPTTGVDPVSRREFCARFTRILAEQFPDEMLEANLTSADDLEHSISGNYARGILRSESGRQAVLVVPSSEGATASSNSLTFGLLWLARSLETSGKAGITGLKLIVPRGAGEMPVRLAKTLSSSIHLEIYEFDLRTESIVKIDPASFANRDNWLVACRNREMLLDRASAELNPIVAMSPQAITLHPHVESGDVMLRFRGLAFACWQDGAVFFGDNFRKKATASTQHELKQALHDLEIYRHPSATNTRHRLYRAQPERWLETIVLSDVTRIDPRLDPRFVYTQLFANSATERSILDILTVTKTGRLAIIELKASEHIHLPLQAADYWLRIREHLERGDFSHSGYFPGVELQKIPPLVYLVAPALRFHSTSGALQDCLSSSMEVVRVGLSESWRRGLRVVMRQ